MKSKWQTLNVGTLRVQYCGTISAAHTVLDVLRKNLSDPKILADKLGKIPEHYAVIGRTENMTCAAVDHIRSTPIFWRYDGDGSRLSVGSDAHKLRAAESTMPFDSDALREVAMTGYVTGPHTLISGLSQLEAGEVRCWKNETSKTKNAFSYRHQRSEQNGRHQGSEHEQLEHVIDAAFTRTMNFAGNRPIIVPLSGGLDSRFVLAKLVEKGYGPLKAISYGPPNNPDAETARLVANQLGVTWTYLPTSAKRCRSLLGSKLLNRYWKFADGLSSAPNHQDLLPLLTLSETGDLSPDSVIVNGQTGDFITGGHIPPAFCTEKTVNTDLLIEEILTKHYGLWKNLLVPENLSYARERIRASLNLAKSPIDISSHNAAALFELWEHQERQAKFIVNGQRIYEFLGMDWGLPLWDREFVAFWRDAKLRQKYNQSLYRSWLHQWDYRGVFTNISSQVTAWPKATSSIIAGLAIALRLISGRARRDRLFRYLNYFDRFGDHYKVFGFFSKIGK